MAELRLGSLNVVILLGRACADPDLKYTPKGTPVLNFRIAVFGAGTKTPRLENGRRKPASSRLRSSAGRRADGEVMKKGSAVLVEGRLRSRSWETQNGEKRTVVEVNAQRVQCLDKTFTAAPPSATAGAAPEQPGPATEEVDIPPDQVDDVPF